MFLAALFTAIAVVLGYLFLTVPNVELVTATVFVSGFVLGPLHGCIVGIVTEVIYSGLNPMGMATPNLLIAQALGMALAGYVGGLFHRRRWHLRPALVRYLIFGLAGFLITLVFDVLTTLSFALFMSEPNLNKIMSSFIIGMSFYIVHLVINTVVFAGLVPIILSGLNRIEFDV